MRKAGKLHYDLQCLHESSWPAGFRKTRYDLSPLQSAKMVIGDLDVDGPSPPGSNDTLIDSTPSKAVSSKPHAPQLDSVSSPI